MALTAGVTTPTDISHTATMTGVGAPYGIRAKAGAAATASTHQASFGAGFMVMVWRSEITFRVEGLPFLILIMVANQINQLGQVATGRLMTPHQPVPNLIILTIQ
jgi:hypothetical protein